MKNRIQIDIQDDTNDTVAILGVSKAMQIAHFLPLAGNVSVHDLSIEIEHPASNCCVVVHFDYIVHDTCRIFRVWTHR